MSKKETILQLQRDFDTLNQQYNDLVRDYSKKCLDVYAAERKATEKQKHQYAGSVAFDFFPLRDWRRLSMDKWDTGRYFQLCVGPIRIDFFED